MKFPEAYQVLHDAGFDDMKIIQFFAWHIKHLDLWKKFQAKAKELTKSGADWVGSKSIFEKLRDDAELRKIDDFKANNTYTSMWARLLVAKEPSLQEKFEFRAVGKNIKRAA